MLGETTAELTGNASIGKFTGALGVFLTGTDAEGVNTAFNTASNAVNNNYLMPHEKAKAAKLLEEQKNCSGTRCTEIKDELAELQKISDKRDQEFLKLEKLCNGGKGDCSGFFALHYDLRNQLTAEGNLYYLTHKDEFTKLPAAQSKFHTFVTDPNTGKVIGVTSMGMDGYTKLVHPILGYEIVLDKNNAIITNALNAGTYNFYNPNIKGIEPNPLLGGGDLFGIWGNHKTFDVDPYFDFGNAKYPIDPTTKEQRNDRIYYFP